MSLKKEKMECCGYWNKEENILVFEIRDDANICEGDKT